MTAGLFLSIAAPCWCDIIAWHQNTALVFDRNKGIAEFSFSVSIPSFPAAQASVNASVFPPKAASVDKKPAKLNANAASLSDSVKKTKTVGDHFLSALTWIGNLTWGLFNSLIGFILFIGALLHLAGKGEKPVVRLSRTGEQIVLENGVYGDDVMSLGIFQFGQTSHIKIEDKYTDDEHETGHARQSAVLGPFYLPLVGISYANVGGPYGFIEDWADDWAPPKPEA